MCKAIKSDIRGVVSRWRTKQNRITNQPAQQPLPLTDQPPPRQRDRGEAPDSRAGASDIRALTGLRGAAAMLVVAYHFWPTAETSTGWLKWTVGRGYLWVDLFFVLSGYVIALNYGKLFAHGFSGPVFAGFLVRRIARLYPLYAVLLGAQIIYTIATYGQFDQSDGWAAVAVAHPARDIPANLLLVQSLGISPSIVTQAWSISTEFAAYFCFPLFVALVISGAWRSAVVAGLAAIVLLATVAAIATHDGAPHSGSLDAYDGTRITPVMRCLGGFILGMLTFRLSTIPVLTKIAARDSVGLVILGAVIGVLAAGAPDLAVVTLFPAVILSLSQNLGLPAAIFSNPVMYGLGAWSYAVYLLHPLLQKPRDVVDGMLVAYMPHDVAAALALSITMAVLLMLARSAYHGIELPGRRAIQRIASGMISR